MPDDDDDDDDGGDGAHAKSTSDPPEGRAGEDVIIAWDFLGKEGERSAMTHDRVALLEGAGFVWEARNGRGGASLAVDGELHDVQSGNAGKMVASLRGTLTKNSNPGMEKLNQVNPTMARGVNHHFLSSQNQLGI